LKGIEVSSGAENGMNTSSLIFSIFIEPLNDSSHSTSVNRFEGNWIVKQMQKMACIRADIKIKFYWVT